MEKYKRKLAKLEGKRKNLKDHLHKIDGLEGEEVEVESFDSSSESSESDCDKKCKGK